MKILGIDPGTKRIGYGLIEKKGKKLVYLDSGLLKIHSHTPGTVKINSEYLYLLDLEKSFKELIKKNKPDLIALEKLFFMRNKKTAMKVARAKGILILTALKKKIPLIEINPTEVKFSLTGDGKADKIGVAKMVNYFLNINYSFKVDDIADALAIAICVALKLDFQKYENYKN